MSAVACGFGVDADQRDAGARRGPASAFASTIAVVVSGQTVVHSESLNASITTWPRNESQRDRLTELVRQREVRRRTPDERRAACRGSGCRERRLLRPAGSVGAWYDRYQLTATASSAATRGPACRPSSSDAARAGGAIAAASTRRLLLVLRHASGGASSNRSRSDRRARARRPRCPLVAQLDPSLRGQIHAAPGAPHPASRSGRTANRAAES